MKPDLPPSLAPLAAAGLAHRQRIHGKASARAKLAETVATLAYRFDLDAASVAALLNGLAAEYEKRAHAERAER